MAVASGSAGVVLLLPAVGSTDTDGAESFSLGSFCWLPILASATVEATSTTAGGVSTFFGGKSPNVRDDCPPDGAKTREVVRLYHKTSKNNNDR